MQQTFEMTYFHWLAITSIAAVFFALLFLSVLVYALVLRRRWLAADDRFESLRLTAAEMATRLEDRERALDTLECRARELEERAGAAEQDRAALTAELAASEKAKREQAELVQQNEARLREAFAALSSEALGRNNQMFLSLAKAQLGEFTKGATAELDERRAAVDRLVKPIGETLDKMNTALVEAEKQRSVGHGQIVALNESLALETNRLTRALHHTSARGQWGELQLRRVVEMAGMVEHCDFDVQVTGSANDGSRIRPDLVVRLAGGRSIVVDAKAPMDHYLKSQTVEDRREVDELLAKHAREVRTRMTELGSKAYWNSFDGSPEFVVMFFPSESVFADALRYDADLINFASNHNVIPASPVTLIALLRAAAYGWRQERATENAKLIFELGCELYDRFSREYQHIAGIGQALSRAVDSFNKCTGSAEHKLFPSLRKFTALLGKDLFPTPAEIEARPRSIEQGADGENSEVVQVAENGAANNDGS